MFNLQGARIVGTAEPRVVMRKSDTQNYATLSPFQLKDQLIQFDLNSWSQASGGVWEYWFTTGGAAGFRQLTLT
jgi:hypothetical protein